MLHVNEVELNAIETTTIVLISHRGQCQTVLIFLSIHIPDVVMPYSLLNLAIAGPESSRRSNLYRCIALALIY